MENKGNMVSPQCPIAVCAHIRMHDKVDPILRAGPEPYDHEDHQKDLPSWSLVLSQKQGHLNMSTLEHAILTR